ncbi:MAG: BlaI/MecI/CopY family transcriptional regulator [Candidatus Aminicenantes bacterium]|nr:MAG: BlaI/MecI/CopY family transcriptional regulator [Candidatus Aminicenantes bacterium]
MGNETVLQLTRREEEIMDIIFRMGEASVADIMAHLTDSPTSGAVRRLLNILYAKGAVEYRHDAARKVYRSKIKRDAAGEKALKHVVETFFYGSAAQTMASLFNNSNLNLSSEERQMLKNLIEKAKEKGR